MLMCCGYFEAAATFNTCRHLLWFQASFLLWNRRKQKQFKKWPAPLMQTHTHTPL